MVLIRSPWREWGYETENKSVCSYKGEMGNSARNGEICSSRPLKLTSGQQDRVRGDRPVNLWHNVSSASLYGRQWLSYGSYWEAVDGTVERLQRGIELAPL